MLSPSLMRRFAPFTIVIALATVACDFAPEDEPAGPLRRAGRAPDPSGAAIGAPAGADGTGASGGTTGGASSGTSTDLSTPTPPATVQLATGLRITEVALFQGVKVSLAKEGAKTTARAMPAIAGRAGLVRVYVTPEATWSPHPVTAELHLVTGGTGLPIARDVKTIAGASSEGDLGSTFNFDLDGQSLPAGAEYFVELVDATAAPTPTGTASGAQHPRAGGTESLDLVSGDDQLDVVLVPIRYGADGSNRLPDTSAPVLDAVAKRTLELYPVPKIAFSLHAPIDANGPISADGTGWSSVLAQVTQLRLAEKPAADVYYFGVFAPAASVAAYCPKSCVLGLSNLGASVNDAASRASVGVLYNDPFVFETLPHEVGHAHGRAHAPCGGAAGPDAAFPYTDATIGTWGYSIVQKTLIDPNATKTPHDFMSYCGPEWTSDYTFRALFERGRALRATQVGQPLRAPQKTRTLHLLLEADDGSLMWHDAPAVTSDAPLGGEVRRVTYRDASGNVLGADEAHRYAYDHLGGASLFVPEPPAGTARVEIEGGGTISAL
ncbi:MAG: M66 family metalloprotease [Polyangiaceae bacterium]